MQSAVECPEKQMYQFAKLKAYNLMPNTGYSYNDICSCMMQTNTK